MSVQKKKKNQEYFSPQSQDTIADLQLLLHSHLVKN